ncbi:uncharacterized protein LOC113500538 [Trichoplusia ni]|uniref:Uncharacterized protein LOC113500538 n=1 Tax=Trichoplusia ni TaxID=7111 RepID=A0A7E5W8Z7_TRINI|nr:uncharacterized protein LOC113500538 [Trichoplusia ni]XP_026737169.1 uncharacterized protein LOC113500538 [Trichoplusia ni]
METFIGLVRQLPCLWDTECKEYRDMRKKDNAWKRIVEELKRKDIPDIKTAKAEWKKLRDSHRDSLKRARATSGSDSVIINKWKYAEIMEFLLPYMKTRKRRRNLTTSSDENKDSSPSPSDSFLVVQPSTSTTDTLNFTTVNQTEKILNTPEPSEHKFRKRKMDNEIGEIMIDMGERNNGRFGESGKHPLDSFFESMCETTKQFPTWLQYSVKRKIFNVISEAEDTFETYKSRETIF